VAKIHIRKLKKGDATAIKRINSAITKMPSVLDFRRIVTEKAQKKTDASFVAVVDGNVVGYMIGYITLGNFGVDQCGWITMLGVDPKFMGQGIGVSLAKKIFAFYKDKGVSNVFTSMRWDFTDLLSFFKKLGFDRSDFINLRKILD